MKKKNLTMAGVAVLGLVFMTPTLETHAASLIDMGLTGSGSAAAENSANVSNALDTSTSNTNVNTDTNVDASVNANVGASTNGQTGNTSAGTNMNSMTSVNASANMIGDDENISIMRSDIKASAKANSDSDVNSDINSGTDMSAEGNSMISGNISPDTIQTSADLRAYATSKMNADANIDEMNFAKDTVVIGYKEHGRLLGFIPVVMTLKAKAHADGSVEVNYPWYSFMVSKDKASLEAKLKAAVEARSNNMASATSTTVGNAEASFNASSAADIAARMHTVLREAYEAEENAQANANVNANANGSAGVSY
jgi:hypothetical protein